MTNYENLSVEEKIRATIHRDTHRVCTESCHLLGLDVTNNVTNIIAELIYKKLRVYGTDLEAFAKHAKRNTINSDDVKLLARRNPSLKEYVNKLVSPTVAKEKKRKSTAPVFSNKRETIPPPKLVEDEPVSEQTADNKQAVTDDEKMEINTTIDLTFD